MVRCYCLSLLVLSSLSALSPSRERPTKECVDTPPPAKRFTIRHIEPQGVGYHQGYTTLDFFAALASPPNFIIPFVDVRGHIFDHGQPAVNAGFGLRFLTSSWVFGANGYFDYRKTKRAPYTQIGVGCEMLGQRVDLRLNGYFPAGNTKSDIFHTKFSHFKDHYAILKSRYEFAMMGLNAEVGAHITNDQNAKCYAALGPYYFTGQGKHAVGGSARLSGTFYEYLKLEASGSYDPVFKWIGQGQIGLVFSFGPTKSPSRPICKQEPLLWQRTVQPVDRNEIIVLDRKNKESRAIDPLTGDPYLFWFVNNLSHSQGTIESPFPTVTQAENASNEGDIIYVFSGSGASYDVGTGGLALKNSQKLWGSATEQTLRTTLGEIAILPATGSQPIISGGSPSAGIVYLAHHNEISGIHLSAGGSVPVYAIGRSYLSAAMATDGVCIKNNTIDGIYGPAAIRIYGKGVFIIENNIFSVSMTQDPNRCAIEIVNSDHCVLNSVIRSNSINVSTGFGGILVAAYGSGQLTTTIQANTVAVSGNALVGIEAAAGVLGFLNAAIHSNRVTTPGGSCLGIRLSPYVASAGTICVQLTDNITSPPSIVLGSPAGGVVNVAPSLGNIPATFTRFGIVTDVTSCPGDASGLSQEDSSN